MGAGSSSKRRKGDSAKATKRAPRASRDSRTPKAKTFQFTIPSLKAAIRDVHKTIMDEVERNKYDEKSVFGIRLALEEALVNAILHGNKLDASKTVHIEAQVSPKTTEITIEDQGAGFIRDCVPDPCAKENLLKPSGRGLLLMESFMDKLEYTHGGRRVRMVKKNES